MQIRTLENASFLLIVGLVTVAFLALIGGFLMPVFWAAVLAVIFSPMYRRMKGWLKGRKSLAALITLLAIVVIVIAPLVGVGIAVTGEATGLYTQIASGEIDLEAAVTAIEEQMPRVQAFADQFRIDLDRVQEGVSNAALTVSRAVASEAVSIGQQAIQFVILLALTLYLLFFFLRDGDALVDALVKALPLGDVRERRLFSRFAAVSRATIKGTFVVAVVQGTLGGVMFAILGIGAPVLWGVLMGLLSLLPAVGSAAVWGPAAIYLLLTGQIGAGIALIATGAVLIGGVDNVLRPILVGRDTQMPDYLILLSTLGGLAAFGLSGVIVGPIVAALFLTVWEMFVEDFGSLDDPEVPATASPPADPQATDAEMVVPDAPAGPTASGPA